MYAEVFLLHISMKKTLMTVAVIIAFNFAFAAFSQYAAADLYKKGATGAGVTEIQTRLKAWGYYTGAVDGVYGSGTEKAVRYFQRSNGLTEDGQCGAQTLAALGLPTNMGGGSRGSSQRNHAASRMRGRSPWARSFSTASAMPRSLTLSPA